MAKTSITSKPHGNKIDLLGQQFGRLIVTKEAGKDNQGLYCWVCRCECGNEITVSGHSLRLGRTSSCGCLRVKTLVSRTTKHNRCHSTTYKIWKGIHKRCYNENMHEYLYYGGRGITVCERWRDFNNFFEDMGERPSQKHSLDRWPDMNGNYEPKNCRWATQKEQARNTRRNRMLTIDGETKSLIEWVEKHNLNYGRVSQRIIKLGWSAKEAIFGRSPEVRAEKAKAGNIARWGKKPIT